MRTSNGGNTPWRLPGLSCLSPAMREERFLHHSHPAAAPPPASDSIRDRIEINWWESEATTIEIRHHYIEAATQARFISLKPSRWQGHDAQLVLDTLDQMILASRQRRWGR